MSQKQGVQYTSIECTRSSGKNNIVIHVFRAGIRFLIVLSIDQTSQCTQNTLRRKRIIKYGEKT